MLYGIRFIDGGEQFVKVNPNGTRGAYVDQGRVECSSFELTNAGRPHIEPNPGGCYTGGIDVHGGWDWVVRNNRFASIYCDNGSLPEHAVHFWTGSRGTLVENNVITNCGRGIGFGLGDTRGERVYPDRPYGGALLGHYDGVIRNNVIWANNAVLRHRDRASRRPNGRSCCTTPSSTAPEPRDSSDRSTIDTPTPMW